MVEEKYNLKMENGRINITDVDFAKGDKLIINGIEQLVIDICEADVFTDVNGEEKQYFMEEDGNKTYLNIQNGV